MSQIPERFLFDCSYYFTPKETAKETKLGEGLYCYLQCLIYISFLLTALTKYLLLSSICLKKWLSSCKAALVTVAKRDVWGNNVGKKWCY